VTMQKQIYIAIEALVNSDATLERAEREVILNVCHNPLPASTSSSGSAVSLLSAKDVAERLRVTPRTVDRWRETGILPSCKWGVYRRYKVADVEKLERRFIEEKPVYKKAQQS